MSQNISLVPSAEAIRKDWRLAAKLIDHTLLRPEATREQVARLCREAAEYGFYSVMVNPSNLAQCRDELRSTGVVVGTVIGFPLGATTSTAKLAEATDSLRLGATELDMVINIGALKSGQPDLVQMEMRSLVQLCHGFGALVKVIIETALLNTEEKNLACQLAAAVEVDFVKTSTGFSSAGATAADVALMRGVVGNRIGVKAAGGIRTAADLLAMVDAGASRIGASSSVAIVKELGAS
ncbi:MAG: deoxyribose-phosphate aldolase [Acidobacteria bacterium]|nr:MAG: deoxyribose-phosphate aldolase [Acidobacteriota bacterium]